jgi:hypothetical protein
MMAAYLEALLIWAARHAADTSTITIPTGIVSVGELVRVLAALDRARSNQTSSTAARRVTRIQKRT